MAGPLRFHKDPFHKDPVTLDEEEKRRRRGGDEKRMGCRGGEQVRGVAGEE